VTLDGATHVIHTQLVGDYNLPNILSAVTVGHFFGVSIEQITKAIEAYIPTNSRSQLISRKNNTFVLDAYNANPSSMRVAIENFARQPHPAKYICLGAMMELGAESLAEHQAIVELLKQYSWADVLLVGGDFAKITHGYRYFSDAESAAQWLQHSSIQNGMFLIKGSRSMKMETLMQAFELE
jgi:UDP-N-acetylmuramoyl-tripeptide--D-alanyl-D-alanine ligase